MNEIPNWEKIIVWYDWLNDDARRGLKARLKRCKTTEEIYFQPSYAMLLKSMDSRVNNFFPVIAGVLAHTKCPEKYSPAGRLPLAQRMAQSRPGQERPRITPVHFRQLLACEDENKLLRLLIRIVKQVELFDIKDFAESVYCWKHDAKAKKRWAFAYYKNLSEQFLT